MRPNANMRARGPRASAAPTAGEPGASPRAELAALRRRLEAAVTEARAALRDGVLEKRAQARVAKLREQMTTQPGSTPGAVSVRALARPAKGVAVPLAGAAVRLVITDKALAEATVDDAGAALLPVAEVKPGTPYEVEVLAPDCGAVGCVKGKWSEDGTSHVVEVAPDARLEPYLRRGGVFADAVDAAHERATTLVATVRQSLEAQIASAERQIAAIDRELECAPDTQPSTTGRAPASGRTPQSEE